MRHAGRALSDRGIYLRRDMSLARAQCPGCGAQATCAFDWAIMRMCEHCRASSRALGGRDQGACGEAEAGLQAAEPPHRGGHRWWALVLSTASR